MAGRTRPDSWYRQSAALPYRRREGRFEILLITSLKKKRWIIPKGIVEPGLSPGASAAKEALEEAGVVGEVSPRPVAVYEHRKWGGTCRVEVFPLRVTETLDRWPEAEWRERRWLTLAEAVRRVEQKALRAVLRRFGQMSGDQRLT
ncbi:MAG: NUDIX hydrolase [Anaerolineae bacterium]